MLCSPGYFTYALARARNCGRRRAAERLAVTKGDDICVERLERIESSGHAGAILPEGMELRSGASADPGDRRHRVAGEKHAVFGKVKRMVSRAVARRRYRPRPAGNVEGVAGRPPRSQVGRSALSAISTAAFDQEGADGPGEGSNENEPHSERRQHCQPTSHGRWHRISLQCEDGAC